MPPLFKDLTVEELRADYSTRHGFVFQSNTRSSDGSIENICNVLINKEITSEYPEFIVRLNDTTIAFVYVGDDFNSPKFMYYSTLANRFGFFKVESLVNVLK